MNARAERLDLCIYEFECMRRERSKTVPKKIIMFVWDGTVSDRSLRGADEMCDV